MLNLINQTREQYGIAPVQLDQTESNGTGSCVGSMGHSKAMQDSGFIWHSNTAYPAASFANDVCGYYSSAGENVGSFDSQDESQALISMHQMMMQESPDTPSGCGPLLQQGGTNHACTILNPAYSQVGIGIIFQNGITWLTEDFKG